MDFITHGVVGAATGAVWGRPITGAVIAMAPDIPLIGKRVLLPPKAYVWTHSYLFAIVWTVIALLVSPEFSIVVFTALMSHLFLDMLTHEPLWSPRLAYPWDKEFYLKVAPFGEWEFFNASWWFGLGVSILWIGICLRYTL